MKIFYFFALLLCLLPSLLTCAQHKRKPVKHISKPVKLQQGTASYYADKFNGRKTANGEVYDGNKMTCAHNTLPFGTWVKVTNLQNNKSVVVRVTDRLHFKNKRVVDLSKAAAAKLGYIKKGLATVKVEIIEKKLLSL